MSAHYPPVTIPHTEVRMLSSAHVDQAYQIYVALPFSYADSDAIYPVLYVLDANAFFGMVRETVHLLQLDGQFPELLIVGIGYPVNGFLETIALRTRDTTPTEDEETLQAFLQGTGLEPHGTGGAANFLRFIREELMPFVDANYRSNPDEQTLAGGSAGGRFALYTLFDSPQTFAHYIVCSPALDWDGGVMFDYEAGYAAKHADLAAQVFLAAGSAEPEALVAGVAKMAEVLESRRYASLALTTHLFEGETHLSAAPATFCRGLRVVFSQGR